MDLHLLHKRAFISGSTQGIGFAIAMSLLREGVEVIINGRDNARVESSVQKLRTAVAGANVSGIAADFGEVSEVDALLDVLGDVDILVNNVGLFGRQPFEQVSDADWMKYINVNLMSGVRLSRRLLPRMLDAGWGRIIFISSESGVNIPADMTHYGVTKAGMIALSNGLSKLTRGSDVTVNAILGGPTYSDGVAATVGQIAESKQLTTDQLKAAIISENTTSLLKRFIEPDELANLAVYLASPVSSATNGAALRADGGVLTSML